MRRSILCVEEASGLFEAFGEVVNLLSLGVSDDVREGPRWLKLSRDELWEHLLAHLEKIEGDDITVDEDTNHMVAAHVVARALMILQHDITRRKEQL